jgi:hypothetical protein
VWVSTRITDHILGKILPRLGFPDVDTGLRQAPQGLPGLRGPGVTVEVLPGPGTPSHLFPLAQDFDHFISAGVRSYGRGTTPDRWSCIDLIKDHPSTFTPWNQGTVRLTTAQGSARADSVFVCGGGRWSWKILGYVDRTGRLPQELNSQIHPHAIA